MAVVLKTSVYKNQPRIVGKEKGRAVTTTEPSIEMDPRSQPGKAPSKKSKKARV